jgi:hypothetical protein
MVELRTSAEVLPEGDAVVLTPAELPLNPEVQSETVDER